MRWESENLDVLLHCLQPSIALAGMREKNHGAILREQERTAVLQRSRSPQPEHLHEPAVAAQQGSAWRAQQLLFGCGIGKADIRRLERLQALLARVSYDLSMPCRERSQRWPSPAWR